jgi:ribosome-associated translation inhibitor RaiA
MTSNEFFGGFEDRLLMMEQISGEAKAITKSDMAKIQEKSKALKKLVDEDKEHIAKYKIEVHLHKDRSGQGKHFVGIVVVFQTGALSGGGDEIVYPCPDSGCDGYIAYKNKVPMKMSYICPTCLRLFPESELKEMTTYKQDINGWANVLAKTFRRTGNKADIFLKTHWRDLRAATRAEIEKSQRGQALYKARERVVLRYSLDAILKDTIGGSSLEARMKGFLGA